jgi:hypothetical protein
MEYAQFFTFASDAMLSRKTNTNLTIDGKLSFDYSKFLDLSRIYTLIKS